MLLFLGSQLKQGHPWEGAILMDQLERSPIVTGLLEPVARADWNWLAASVSHIIITQQTLLPQITLGH